MSPSPSPSSITRNSLLTKDISSEVAEYAFVKKQSSEQLASNVCRRIWRHLHLACISLVVTLPQLQALLSQNIPQMLDYKVTRCIRWSPIFWGKILGFEQLPVYKTTPLLVNGAHMVGLWQEIPSLLFHNMRGLHGGWLPRLHALLPWQNLLSLFSTTPGVFELQNDGNIAMVSVSLIGSWLSSWCG